MNDQRYSDPTKRPRMPDYHAGKPKEINVAMSQEDEFQDSGRKNKRNHVQEHECDGNCAAAIVLRRTIQGIFATILHNKKPRLEPRLATEEVNGTADGSTVDLSTTMEVSTKSPSMVVRNDTGKHPRETHKTSASKRNEALAMSRNKQVSMSMSQSARTTKPTARMAETTPAFPKYKIPTREGRRAIVESVLGSITDTVGERQQTLPVLGVTQTYVSQPPIPPVVAARTLARTLASEDPQGSATTPHYLPELLDSIKDRDTLLRYLGSPDGYKFLQECGSNLCLIFEVPGTEKDRKAANNLVDEGKFSTERWAFVVEIHVVFPPLESSNLIQPENCQGYIAKEGKCPHYQGTFVKFMEALIAFERPMKVHLYDPRKNHSNHFLVVVNVGMDLLVGYSAEWLNLVSTLETQIPDIEDGEVQVTQVTHRDRSTDIEDGEVQVTRVTHPDGSTKRQKANWYKDLGFCSNRCTSRQGSVGGVSKPRLKPGTMNTFSVSIFLYMSKFIKSQRVPWLDSHKSVYVDTAERQLAFAGEIHRDNIVELLRLSKTTLLRQLGTHFDRENPELDTMEAVVGCNILVRDPISKELVRWGFNGAGRRSACAFMRRCSTDLPLPEYIGDVYSKIPIARRNISVDLFDGELVEFFPGIQLIRNPCNFNPASYHLPYTHYIFLLVEKFQLSFPETVSVQTSMEFLHHTPLFFIAACKCVLQSCTASMFQSTRDNRPGYRLGYILMQLIEHFYQKTRETSGTMAKYRRYALYYKVKLPTWQQWNARCDFKVILCLFAFSCYGTMNGRKKCRSIFKLLLNKLASVASNAGDLAIIHSISVMSQVGLLPSWMRECTLIKGDNKYMLHFAQRFYGKRANVGFNVGEVEQILDTTRGNLEARFGGEFPENHIENILCKTYRVDGIGNDSMWCDLLDPHQNIFKFVGETVMILHEEKWIHLPGNAVVDRWPYGSDMLTPVEIGMRMRLNDRLMPTDSGIRSQTLTEELLYPSSAHMFEFPYSTRSDIGGSSIAIGETVIREDRRRHREQEMNNRNHGYDRR